MSRLSIECDFRPAVVEDAAGIVELSDLAQAARRGTEVPEARPEDVKRMEQQLKEDSHVWSRLAIVQGRLAGLVLGYPSSDNGNTIDNSSRTQHLSELMVHPDYWRQGIGDNLLDWALVNLPKLGARAVNLWVDNDNNGARSLYESKGFRPTGADRLHPKDKYPQIEYLLASF